MMIESLVKHLAQFAKLDNPIDVERFDATLAQIAQENNPRAIELLAPFFDDKCKFPEAMFSVIHTIERFDDEIYVQGILKVLPQLWSKSPYWANVIHFRIFNHAPSRRAYHCWLAKSGAETVTAAKALLTTMRSREPEFVQACDEMLAIIT